jgi:hypothetical protein
MKKIWLLLLISVFAINGCDSGGGGSSSGGGSTIGGNTSGEAENFMTGFWNGQWTGVTYSTTPEGTQVATPSGGPLGASLQQNGKQLNGSVNSTNLLGGPGQFSATLSNPSGTGNIEMGVMWNSRTSVSFHGTYNRNQIYAVIGPPTTGTGQSGASIQGSLTMTR